MSRWLSRPVVAALTIALLLAVALPWAALADDISNNLDASVDATAEAMALTAGGTTGTTQLFVVPRNGDGKSGCNLTSSTTLVVAVASSNAAVATVSPTSVTFTSCGDQRQLAVTPLSQGSTTITLSQTSNTTTGTFNLQPATFAVNVSAPEPINTPPVVTVTGVTNGESYEIGAVPVAGCTVVDAEDTNETAIPVITGTLTHGLGAQTATCTYTDGGGLTASESATYSIVDTNAPVVTCDAADGLWHAANVSIACIASDSGSGLASAADASFSLSTSVGVGSETNNALTDTRTVCDNAGNCASAGPIASNLIDRKAPDVLCGFSDGLWHASDAEIGCTATDGGAGLADPADTSFVLSTNVPTDTEDADAATDSRLVADTVGNAATAGPVGGNKIDKKVPSVSPGDISDMTWRNTALSQAFTATDAGSGLADPGDAFFTLTATLESTRDGNGDIVPTTVSKTVADQVGNATTRSVSALIDLTAPRVQEGAASGTTGTNGWYTSSVTVDFTATDALAGLAAPLSGASDTFQQTTSGEGSSVTVASGAVADLAGNVNTGSTSASFKIDLTDPTSLTFTGGPAQGASYYFGTTPAAPTCAAEDAVSGIASCVVSGFSYAVGQHTLTATATDNAGRTATASLTYTVLAWTLSGFYQPVAMTPSGGAMVWNTVKGGSTVPLKFEIFMGAVDHSAVIASNELTDVAIVSSLAKQVTCNGGIEDTVDVVATGNTSMRYDATAGQFIYNWQTPKQAGKCYSLTLTTQDGSSLTAYFKLK
jgi:hypothetical protein